MVHYGCVTNQVDIDLTCQFCIALLRRQRFAFESPVDYLLCDPKEKGLEGKQVDIGEKIFIR